MIKHGISYKTKIDLGEHSRQITRTFTVVGESKPTTEQILEMVREHSGGNFDTRSIKMIEVST